MEFYIDNLILILVSIAQELHGEEDPASKRREGTNTYSLYSFFLQFNLGEKVSFFVISDAFHSYSANLLGAESLAVFFFNSKGLNVSARRRGI